MTTFYLVRHGAKERIQGDPPLSAVGIKQAEITAETLKKNNISAIFVSPRKRTRQTAEIISRKPELHLKEDKRLDERMNWGDKKGISFEEFWKEWLKTQKDRDYQPFHGDSSKNTGNRMQEFIAEKSELFPNKNILIITHGGAIGDLLMNIFTTDRLSLVVDSDSKIKYIEILECSITEVQKNGEVYNLKRLKDISHLQIPIL